MTLIYRMASQICHQLMIVQFSLIIELLNVFSSSGCKMVGNSCYYYRMFSFGWWYLYCLRLGWWRTACLVIMTPYFVKRPHAGLLSGSRLWRGPVLLPSKAMFLVQFELQNLRRLTVTALCTRHTVLRLHNIQIDKIAILSYSTTIFPRFSKNFIATVPPYFIFLPQFLLFWLVAFSTATNICLCLH